MKPLKPDGPPLLRIPATLLGTFPLLAAAAEEGGRNLPPPWAMVEVTASAPAEPAAATLDPRAPGQVPAQDGAEVLLRLPGFAQVRKGGTDGDPILRGMAGSRLAVLVDGEETPGGCGGRMDPPTAYVFPQSYDRIQVVKGPQTVLHGPGNSAGTVLFQREPRTWGQPGWAVAGSWLVGGRGRGDRLLDVQGGNDRWYARALGLHSRCSDYRSGNGQDIHSCYDRWSAHGALGWTPNERTRLECRATRSDGEAAYADRGMDGVRFLRRNAGLAFESRDLTPLVEKLEVQAYWNDIDHVMDNGTLRAFTPSPGFPAPMARNPQRTTRGARFALGLRLDSGTGWELGGDLSRSRHTVRRSADQWALPVEGLPRLEDAELASAGLFSEWTRNFPAGHRVVAGLRLDQWHAEDKRTMLAGNVPDSTAHAHRDQTLVSGFARYERPLGPATGFVGLGHVQRAPDYWELFAPEAVASASAFHTRPERTTQLDFGSTREWGRFRASLSGFYGRVSDFILIQSAFPKSGMGGGKATVARNIQAGSWGGELAGTAWLTGPWKADGSMAYTRGENLTDHCPLGQIPPLEARLGLDWGVDSWSWRSSVRMVAPQDRFALNQGTIAGQDLGRTPGFAVFSLNGRWRPWKRMGIQGGIENLFDRAYAEHISRSAIPVPGYTMNGLRIEEPGRSFWLRLDIKFPG